MCDRFEFLRPNAKYTRDALKFYAQIARRAIAAGHAIDIFACNLDQDRPDRVHPSNCGASAIFLASALHFSPQRLSLSAPQRLTLFW